MTAQMKTAKMIPQFITPKTSLLIGTASQSLTGYSNFMALTIFIPVKFVAMNLIAEGATSKSISLNRVMHME